MRIAFIVRGNTRRNKYLNGYSLRYGGAGASGTDTSSILVAEYLAKQGHEVVIVTDILDEPLENEFKANGGIYTPGEEFYGVRYTNTEFEGIDNKTFDILVSMLWYTDYNELPITVTKSIIYWSHMQWIYGLDELIKYATNNNLSIGIVNISDWQRSCNQGIVNHIIENYPRSLNALIPNPIFDEIINEVINETPIKKTGKFIFHSTWTTGGNTSLEAVRQVNIPNKEFHAFDYFITVDHHTDDFFYNHGSCDRKTVFTHLAESEYLVNPLNTIHKTIRKDTFALTVAEALALGVIVLTYPLGALPGNYKDYCVWLDAPDGVNLDEIKDLDLIRDEEGKFNQVNHIVDKINYLEQNPKIKEHYKNAGQQYVLDNFNINKIGSIWDEFINNLNNI
jgi:glycosyltransferase involved in cell wall biosynthesis